MKFLKVVLTTCVILGLIYLGIYGYQDLRTRSVLNERSENVHTLRETATQTPTDVPEREKPTPEAVNTPAAEADATELPAETDLDNMGGALSSPEGEKSISEAPADAFETPNAAESVPEATAAPVENISVTQAPDMNIPTDAPVATEAPTGRPVTEAPATSAPVTEAPTQAPTAEPDPLLDYYAQLHAENGDMVGWVYVEDTLIDYPVMHTPEDEEFYLHKNFEKTYSFAGTPFIDFRCELEPRCDNVIIYAHNMKNGTLFGQLSKYLEKEFFDGHPFITFDMLLERGEYEVFAVIPVYMGKMDDERMRCYGVSMTEDESQVEALYAYLDTYAVHVKEEALPKVGDKIVTLSTCTGYRDADRLVVMGRKIN